MDENTAKIEFGRRLSKAFDRIGVPPVHQGRFTEVTKLMGVQPRSVKNWVDGVKLPTTERIWELAALTGVRVEWLQMGEGPMLPDPDLTAEEKALLAHFRGMTGADKSRVLKMAEVFSDTFSSDQAAEG